MSSNATHDINNFTEPRSQPSIPVLQDAHELIGTLENVELVGGGLVKIRIAGLERLVAEELVGQLKGMVGKRASILRVGDEWSVVEVINLV